MNAAQIATVAGLHARCVLNARDLEASADRHDRADPDRAAQARDYAALLTAAGAQVLIPEPGQLSLFGDGQ
jgi:hypothetical protein